MAASAFDSEVSILPSCTNDTDFKSDHVLAKLRAAETPPKGLALDELILWFKKKFTQDINRSLVSEPMTIRCNFILS